MLRDDVDVAELEREPISPELALVSPELAELARARLPDRPDFLSELTAKRNAAAAAPAAPPSAPAEPAPRRRERRPLGRGVSALALLGATALGLLVGIEIGGNNGPNVLTSPEFIPAARGVSSSAAPPTANRHTTSGVRAARAQRRAAKTSRTVSRAAKTSRTVSQRNRKATPTHATKTVRHPAAPKPRRSLARTLTWSRVRGASYYDVRLFQGAVRILDLWPSKPKVQVPSTWIYGGLRYRLQPGRYRWFVYPGIGKPSQLRLQKLHKAGVLTVPR